MNKHRPQKPAEVELPPVQPDVEPEPKKQRMIEAYRRCPVCWEGNGGYGDCYSTQGRTRYYKCKQTTKPDGAGPCGHTWTATVLLETIKVEHRRVTLDGER